jgi:hypothetical protein
MLPGCTNKLLELHKEMQSKACCSVEVYAIRQKKPPPMFLTDSDDYYFLLLLLLSSSFPEVSPLWLLLLQQSVLPGFDESGCSQMNLLCN